jgi:hypothetical protein
MRRALLRGSGGQGFSGGMGLYFGGGLGSQCTGHDTLDTFQSLKYFLPSPSKLTFRVMGLRPSNCEIYSYAFHFTSSNLGRVISFFLVIFFGS